jgi:hypothetical protein
MRRYATLLALSALCTPLLSSAQADKRLPWKSKTEFQAAFCDSFKKIMTAIEYDLKVTREDRSRYNANNPGDMSMTYFEIILPASTRNYMYGDFINTGAYNFGDFEDSLKAYEAFKWVKEAMIKCIPKGWKYKELLKPDESQRIGYFQIYDPEDYDDVYDRPGRCATLEWTKDSYGVYGVNIGFDPQLW